MAGGTLFFSRSCPHCETLFRSGLVSPTAVRLVPVESAGGRLPPEVHSVPALWLPDERRLVLGKDVLAHFKSKQTQQIGNVDASAAASGDRAPHPFLGDGGVGFGSFGPAGDDAPAGMGSFVPVSEGTVGTRGMASVSAGGGGVETRTVRDSVDVESYKSRRDSELADILGRQRQTF